jgi:DNA polymerase zeta
MSSDESTLRVRINQIDYTLVPPGPLDNSTLPRVPIIRIYGASSKGMKACVHVHQVYPYFFVEYNGQMSPDSGEWQGSTNRDHSRLTSGLVNDHIARLSHSLNHAIAISMKRNPSSPNSKFVRAIVLVKGVHFYGFHSSYSPFLKVHIADPAYVNRAVTIMQSGTVMRTRFRVFESHLSYILQFLSDFGLYGCGSIDLREVWQRGNGAESEDQEQEDMRLGEHQLFNPSPHFRQSRMPLEVDAVSHQILNRHLLTARNIHHKLDIPAPPLPKEPLVLSVRELWEDERNRRRAKGLTPSPEMPVDLSENSRGVGGDWVAEARWWEEIRKRIEKESEQDIVIDEKAKTWEKWVMTTFESIEALWEEEWKVWKPGGKRQQHDHQRIEENPFETSATSSIWNRANTKEEEVDAEVDETMLSSQEMSLLVEREAGGERDEFYFEDEDLNLEEGAPPDLHHEDGGEEQPAIMLVFLSCRHHPHY